MAWTKLQNAKVSTVALQVPWGDNIDKFVSHFFVAQVALNLTNAVNSHRAGALRFLRFRDQLSAIGRSAFAFDSVVTMPSAANNDDARFAIISFSCDELPPKLGPRRGLPGILNRLPV